LLLLLYFGCTTDYRGIPLNISPSYAGSGHEGSSAFSGVFTAEEVDGVGDKRSQDTTVEVQPLLVAFWKMSLKCAYVIDFFPHWYKAKLQVMRLLFSSARLSNFLN